MHIKLHKTLCTAELAIRRKPVFVTSITLCARISNIKLVCRVCMFCSVVSLNDKNGKTPGEKLSTLVVGGSRPICAVNVYAAAATAPNECTFLFSVSGNNNQHPERELSFLSLSFRATCKCSYATTIFQSRFLNAIVYETEL